MNSSRLRRLVLPAVCLLSLVGIGSLASAVASPSSGNGDRQALAGTKPAWTAKATPSGLVSKSQQESAKVWLAPRNSTELAALARAVSDPSGPQYRTFLTHDQYVARYAPDAAEVAAVTAWLEQAKLKVTSVGPDSHYLAVTGSAAAVTAAFGAQLGLYAAYGSQVQAPTSDLSVPSSLAGDVLAVSGLSTLGHEMQPFDLGAPAAFVNGTPCSASYGAEKALDKPKFAGKAVPYAICGYTPSQFRGAYGVPAAKTGAGQTVAITDAFDASTLLSDANTYATRHGDAAFAAGQFSDNSVADDPTKVAACGGNHWYGEQTLDVEAVHAMATGANVAYYGAASCYDDDLLAALGKVVADDKASIVTNSWGQPTVVANLPQYGCTPDNPCLTIDQGIVDAYESIFYQGAVQGIGFYFSSGDAGDEQAAYAFSHPDWPAGDPWVTAVGGTSLAVGSGNTRLFETGWGTAKWNLSADGSSWVQATPFLYGAGGGYSQIFEQPWYQDGVVTSNPTGGRAVPDIALDGDPTTGMLVGETQSFSLASRFGPAGVHYGEFRLGGTSLASPLMAGAQAVAQEGAGVRIGFANPLLYGLKSQSGGSSSFYDPNATQPDPGNVRADYVNGQNADGGFSYSVRTFDQDSSLAVNHGWDDVTGVGTVTARYFARLSG